MTNWIVENEVWLSVIISAAGVIITAGLTVIIIVLTVKNHNKTIRVESEISKREEKLQERQLKIETYEHKREIYRNAFRVIQFCEYWLFISSKIDLTKKTDEQLVEIINSIKNQFTPDSWGITENLQESKFVFPKELSECLMKIGKVFDNMCAAIRQFGTLNKHLTDEEKKLLIAESRNALLQIMNDSCNEIKGHKLFLESAMEADMSFSNTEDDFPKANSEKGDNGGKE